ncbi:MAG: tRNA (guanosine(46)-N7)-methyltransferase TrmB, partial [Polynucleobacter victoriensis]
MSDKKPNQLEEQLKTEEPRLRARFEDAKDAAGESEHYLHRIKSFVLRTGRLTAGQAKAIETLGPKFLLPYTGQAIDWQTSFSSPENNSINTSRPKILEIGFGMGETTAKIAIARPEVDFLAIEVHEPGVGALLKLIGEQNISNLRLMRHDAVEVVENMIPEGFLDGVHVYFPDPWHKKRHNKRRLIQPDFVALLSSRIKSGGYWHLATDWKEYAEQMMEVLSAEPALTNTGSLPSGYAERPTYRPVTKFENRGIKLGH